MTTEPTPRRTQDAARAGAIVRERDRNEQGRPENARPRDRFGAPLPRGAVDELAGRQEPEDVVSTVAEGFEHGVALFDQKRFFEAHEFFEYIWKHDDVAPGDRDFWKGVTQVAVGFTHIQRGNDLGAITLLRRAAGYLRPYPSPHHGVDTAALRQTAEAMAREVEASGTGPDRDFPRFPRA